MPHGLLRAPLRQNPNKVSCEIKGNSDRTAARHLAFGHRRLGTYVMSEDTRITQRCRNASPSDIVGDQKVHIRSKRTLWRGKTAILHAYVSLCVIPVLSCVAYVQTGRNISISRCQVTNHFRAYMALGFISTITLHPQTAPRQNIFSFFPFPPFVTKPACASCVIQAAQVEQPKTEGRVSTQKHTLREHYQCTRLRGG